MEVDVLGVNDLKLDVMALPSFKPMTLLINKKFQCNLHYNKSTHVVPMLGCSCFLENSKSKKGHNCQKKN